MEIGVLGTGLVGRTIGTKLWQLGHQVMLGSRDEANPTAIAWAKKLGGPHALYGSFRNAGAFGEIVFNCTLGAASVDVLKQVGADNLKGKILIDTSNPIDYSKEKMTLFVCNNDSLGEQIQREFPEARVVKTLNTMNANVMVEPDKVPGRSDVFVSGDDPEAKAEVTRILREWFGWKAIIDLGDITTSRGVEMFLPLWWNLRQIMDAERLNIKVMTS
jgi:predicted dinucleotide-binding enzyme